MSELAPDDLSVVIPTRDRWPILSRTLQALGNQTVAGFHVVIAIDGLDQDPPDLSPAVVVRKEAQGSASARNAGVAAVRTAVTLLLDDDMIPVPDMVERHLEWHARHPEPEVAVLGHVDWHPDLPSTPVSRWLDYSATMFDYHNLRDQAGADVGWGRFYSCNASFKTELFRRVGGFDERFIHYYEDTDLALRFGEARMKLIYEPRARTLHLQSFDWPSIVRRFERVALGERLMVCKHPDFPPWFRNKMMGALEGRAPLPVWHRLVDSVPASRPHLRKRLEDLATRIYYRRLAPTYLASYERAGDLCELQRYLGDAYDPRQLVHHERAVDEEADRVHDETQFYRTSEAYLYDLTVFALSGTKDPYRALLARHLRPGASVLDYGCGIGSDGLRLAAAGFQVSFADFDNPSVRYLRWRLAERGLDAPIYDIENDAIPGGFEATFSFDVIEHVEDPFAFLAQLESLARVVAVNFLEPDPNETHLHRPLPIKRLIDHAAGHDLLSYRLYHGRSHAVVYSTGARRPVRGTAAMARGRLQARVPDHWRRYIPFRRFAPVR